MSHDGSQSGVGVGGVGEGGAHTLDPLRGDGVIALFRLGAAWAALSTSLVCLCNGVFHVCTLPLHVHSVSTVWCTLLVITLQSCCWHLHWRTVCCHIHMEYHNPQCAQAVAFLLEANTPISSMQIDMGDRAL